MAQNPLIGCRISLISKKNIRYEGELYSINEGDATVALKNVKSFGTEGREQGGTFVPPQDAIHPYLVFRGSDIKDLHVHEKPASEPKPPEPTDVPAPPPLPDPPVPNPPASDPSASDPPAPGPPKPAQTEAAKSKEREEHPSRQPQNHSKPRQPRPPRNRNSTPQAQVGTGASLLNRKARGAVNSKDALPESDFDFESNLTKFEKEDEQEAEPSSAYEKDDFFDSISCDAIDKERGLDNRLRGSQERTLNTETFGAVALNTNRRYNRRGGGRGGRGRGRGRGRGGRGRGRNRGYGQQHSNGEHSKSVAAS